MIDPGSTLTPGPVAETSEAEAPEDRKPDQQTDEAARGADAPTLGGLFANLFGQK